MYGKWSKTEVLARIKLILRKLVNTQLRGVERLKRIISRLVGLEAHGKKQIIICGYPRSGTSLFYNMLSSALQNFNIDSWETSALDSIWKFDNHASKSPVDLFQLNEIASKNIHNKELCVVVLMRDIRDIITSRHQFAPDDFVIGYEGAYSFSGEYPNYKKKFDGPGVERYYSIMKDLSDNELFNLIVIKYEHLVSDPDKCQKSILKAFNVEFDGSFSEYHLRKERHKLKYEGKHSALDKKLEKSSDAVEKKYVKRWSEPEYSKRIAEQFTNHPQLFDILIEQGYEASRDWYQEYE